MEDSKTTYGLFEDWKRKYEVRNFYSSVLKGSNNGEESLVEPRSQIFFFLAFSNLGDEIPYKGGSL